ncbi:MAG: hypothetical protein P1U40_10170 [Coxiellaceae bacterium]|nr:hypothetical protein [Coxiellaceae bacterium]
MSRTAELKAQLEQVNSLLQESIAALAKSRGSLVDDAVYTKWKVILDGNLTTVEHCRAKFSLGTELPLAELGIAEAVLKVSTAAVVDMQLELMGDVDSLRAKAEANSLTTQRLFTRPRSGAARGSGDLDEDCRAAVSAVGDDENRAPTPS